MCCQNIVRSPDSQIQKDFFDTKIQTNCELRTPTSVSAITTITTISLIKSI